MSSNSLTTRSAGQTITAPFFNDTKTALAGDFVGRDASGVAASGQNLGTTATPWGAIRGNSLILNGSAVDTSQIVSPVNRIISGAKRTTSNQPAYLVPNGAALSFTLDGTPASLVVDIDGIEVTVSADIVKSSLTAAPSTLNTALVNDTTAAGQEDTKLWGEPQHYKKITIDTVGANISALVGKWAAFKIGTEYFLAFVESATVLSHCYRGYFLDSAITPVNRTVFSNNDTITLMKLGWVFLENNATTIDVSYNNPVWDFASPGGPTTGDYWYDLNAQTWKRYDGVAWQVINRVYIGQIINTTTACVGARAVDIYAKYSNEFAIQIEKTTSEIAKASAAGATVSVAGRTIYFGTYLPSWNITTDLAGSDDMYNATEQASTPYYLYIKDTGETVMSDISPYFRDDLYGQYHPHNPWRCVGISYNDASSDLLSAGSLKDISSISFDGGNGQGATDTAIRRYTTLQESSGGALSWEDTAAAGLVFTARTTGTLSMSSLDGSGSTVIAFGLTKNAQQLTTAINSEGLDATARLNYSVSPSAGNSGGVSWTGKAKVGDTFRAHSTVGGPTNASVAYVNLRVCFIPD